MKNLITQIACTMLLMAFLMSFVSVENTNIRLLKVNGLVEIARREHGLNPALREKISMAAGCDENEVYLDTVDDKKVIVVKIDDVINPAEFWHIPMEENGFLLKIGIE